MSFIHGLGQCVGDAGANPDHRGLLDAELHRDRVGSLEADAADVAGEPIRVLGHDLDRIGTISLENPHSARRTDTVTVQEDYDLPDCLLLGPGGENVGGANRPDAVDFAQPLRRRFNDVEHLLAERPHELLGIDGPHAADHAGREVPLNAIGRGRGRCAQETSSELLAVGAIIHPIARCRDPFSSRNNCGVTHHGHDIPMPKHLGAQNAETVLGIVVGDALDQARQNFLG
jgi:hypothetical protein